MKRDEIFKKLEVIFRDIFEEEDVVIKESTIPEDVENWDSIGHVYLTVEIEDEFKITLGEEMKQIEKVGDIIDLIELRLAERCLELE